MANSVIKSFKPKRLNTTITLQSPECKKSKNETRAVSLIWKGNNLLVSAT